MKRFSSFVVLAAVALVLGACCHHRPSRHGAQGMGGAPAGGSAIYWCNCGPDCKCNAVATKPGKCSCGKELAGGHVIWTEGNTALACACGTSCPASCALDPNDRTKCSCGTPVKRLNLQGTGIHFCNCGGSCGCNTVSDKPGPCKCGMQLHQAK